MAALGADDFFLDTDFDEGTLGAVLQGLLRTYLNSHTADPRLTDLRRLRNGDPLECAETYDTFRTPTGDLVVRLILPRSARRRWRGFDGHEREGKLNISKSGRRSRA